MQKIGMQMHNIYTIYKISDNKKIKIATFKNIVLNQLINKLGSATTLFIHSIWFGTGTTEPAATDTALTKPLWTFSWNYNTVQNYKRASVIKDGLLEMVYTCNVPATSAYVGTVTELGMAFCQSWGNAPFLGTKALIKDAEGNPISITKSDTEELLIEVHVQFQLNDTEEFEWNPDWYRVLTTDHPTQGWGNDIYGFGNIGLAMLPWWPDTLGVGITGSKIYPTVSYNNADKITTVSGGRFGTDNAKTQVYINAIGLNVCGARGTYEYNYPAIYAGWWKFPNSKIFPQTTLTGMSVGIGDGNTREFNPPLALWVKDTEKIYVDGVLKTRNIDYTCDHKNNLSLLFSVMPSAFVKLHNTIYYTNAAVNVLQNPITHPFNRGNNRITAATNPACYTYFNWNSNNPLVWELLEDPQIGLEVDHIVLPSIRYTQSSSLKGLIIKISYSNDLQEWTEVFTFTETRTDGYTTKQVIELPQKITARYWKIEVPNATKNLTISDNNNIYMYCKGSPIVFKEAPANGAIITMDADIDRPMKNSNFILDCNPSFQLS